MRDATPHFQSNRSTRYEITARHLDGRSVVVGFTARTSRRGLLNVLRARGQEVIDHCGIGEADVITFHCRPRVHAKVAGWTIGFTGRTERECQYMLA